MLNQPMIVSSNVLSGSATSRDLAGATPNGYRVAMSDRARMSTASAFLLCRIEEWVLGHPDPVRKHIQMQSHGVGWARDMVTSRGERPPPLAMLDTPEALR